MNLFNYWQVNLIFYLVFMAVFCHHYKKAVKNTKNETASTILLQLIGAVSVLFLIPFSPIKIPGSIGPYLLLLLASIFYAINNKLQTTARKNLEISTFSVINQLSFIFLTLLGFILLKEAVTWQKLTAISLILLGNSILLVKGKKLVVNGHIGTAAASALAAAIGVFISVGVSKDFNLPIYIALTFIIPALVLAAARKVKVNEVLRQLEGAEKTNYLIAATAWGLTIFFSLSALRSGPVSVVAPLQAANVLVNVVSSYFFMNEKTAVGKKIAAAGFIVAAVFVNVYH